MLTEIAMATLVGSVLYGSTPYVMREMKKNTENTKLRKAFMNGEMYRKQGNIKIKPYILKTKLDDDKATFVFSIPKGMDPETFKKKEYVFKQFFNDNIQLQIDNKRGVLRVYQNALPKEYKYNFDDIELKGKLPIVCGKNLDGNVFTFDLVKFPHILISGETGSGKSSAIRSILTTLIKGESPNRLRLVLGDLKRSEFHLFKGLEHVDGVYHSADELRPVLKRIKNEMTKRGNKLDEHGVNSIEDLKSGLPYIIVCIDEVVLLKKETDIMDILEEISSIGRSLGVFVILSMQRPDSQLLDGKLKVNLTVRMGFKTADATNSRIIGTPGAEKLNTPGRMILKVNSEVQEIQCPWLDNEPAKKLLAPYKRELRKLDNVVPLHKEKPEENIWGVLRN